MQATYANKIEQLFYEACQLESPEQRRQFLDDACAGDRKLKQQVLDLLAADEQPDVLLDRPLAIESTEELRKFDHRNESRIGRYKILQEIGEGGFGVVYMAEQTEPVRRKVALKVIKPGMDSRSVVARFEAERQALAMMNHPHIARVLDGGTTESGYPYFVMDLVNGLPITDYCDHENLNTRQRLELFKAVCHAIQHAHHKGIIHRDIKPSNVLVTLHDSLPVVKVIDFGVAKALNQQLTDKTLFTCFGAMVGTPQYMSPEQASLSGLDVDTRSDVYSLGVLLYELLTGKTPFRSEQLKDRGIDEIRRMICETEPAKPSAMLSTLDQATVTQVARHRKAEPIVLRKMLSGDLDWIVMRAIDKERSRRYATALDFAEDVDNYLQGKAVVACPPSWTYKLKKIARRHLGLLSAAALVFLVVSFSSLFSMSQWLAADKANTKLQRTQRELLAEFTDSITNSEPAALVSAIDNIRPLSSEAESLIREVRENHNSPSPSSSIRPSP